MKRAMSVSRDALLLLMFLLVIAVVIMSAAVYYAEIGSCEFNEVRLFQSVFPLQHITSCRYLWGLREKLRTRPNNTIALAISSSYYYNYFMILDWTFSENLF